MLSKWMYGTYALLPGRVPVLQVVLLQECYLNQRFLILLNAPLIVVSEPEDPHTNVRGTCCDTWARGSSYCCGCAMLRNLSQRILTLLYVHHAAVPEPGEPHTAVRAQYCGNWSRGYLHLLCVRHAAATDPRNPILMYVRHAVIPEPGDPHTAACAPCCLWASPRTLALSPKRLASTAGQHLTHHIVSSTLPQCFLK